MQLIIKHKNKFIGIALVTLIASNLLFLPSCGDKKKSVGPPVIYYVHVNDTARRDSIVRASTGSTIRIEGINFSGLTHIFFNGLEARFNPNYTTNTMILVQIPGSTPTRSTQDSVPDELKIVTETGETTFRFRVTPPVPVITQISNELPWPGSEIKIYGSNFFYVNRVIFPGNIQVPANALTVSNNGQEIRVIVPTTLNQGGNIGIIVETQSGRDTSNLSFNYSAGMIANFDDFGTWENGSTIGSGNGGGMSLPEDGRAPSDANSHFFRIEGQPHLDTVSYWGFAVIKVNENRWPSNTILTGQTILANLALQFQAYAVKKWNSGVLRLWLEKDSCFYDFAPWAGTQNYNGALTDVRTDVIHTEWTTYTIPLNLFRDIRKHPTNLNRYSDLSNLPIFGSPDNQGGIGFRFINKKVRTLSPLSNLDMDLCLDDFRIVKLRLP